MADGWLDRCIDLEEVAEAVRCVSEHVRGGQCLPASLVDAVSQIVDRCTAMEMPDLQRAAHGLRKACELVEVEAKSLTEATTDAVLKQLDNLRRRCLLAISAMAALPD